MAYIPMMLKRNGKKDKERKNYNEHYTAEMGDLKDFDRL